MRQLDDELFTSDPFGYLRARIISLLSREPAAVDSAKVSEFRRLLGPSAGLYDAPTERASELQFALDAFALRHHAAESLLRLSYVRLHHKPGESHRVELSDSPTQTFRILEENAELFGATDDGGAMRVRRHLMCSQCSLETAAGNDETSSVEQALDLHASWLNYAVQLLTQESPDLNAANNKFKHGLGLRVQDDVLSRLTETGANPDGTISLSSLTGESSIAFMDGIRAEYLARWPGRRKQRGLELTQLLLTPIPTLVEAAALSHTLGLIFHGAADEHFSDHQPPNGRAIPPHPGLLSSIPRPGALRPTMPFALRFPLTTPIRVGGGTSAGLYWTHGYVQDLRFFDGSTATVVDDATNTD